MENRKSLKSLILISVFVFMFGIAPKTFAYEAETHAYLTAQVIDLYDQYNSNDPIGDGLKPYILDGSRREDDAPRYMNHFYDPVYDRGLDDPEWGGGFSSKDWAQSDSKQVTSLNKPIKFIASILDASAQENIKDMDVNFTWQQAIRYYRGGETEKAMFALGRILHLIEDAGVPDHTRNDGHPEPLGDGSPYEKYTSKFTLNTPDSELVSRLANKKPFDNMPTLSNYFDELARYSNNNFYSEDTIEGAYSLPVSDGSKKLGKYSYFFKNYEGSHYLLARKAFVNLETGTRERATLDDKVLLSDYWSRLSVRSIQVAAGVIKLFFDDVARVEYGNTRLINDDRNPISWAIDNTRAFAQIATSFGRSITSSVSNIAGAFSAQVIDAAKGLFSNATDIFKDNAQIQNPNLLASVSLDENNDTVQSSEQKIIGPSLADRSVTNNDAAAMAIEPSDGSNGPNEINEPDVDELAADETGINLTQDAAQETISGSTKDELLNNAQEINTIQEPIIQACSFQTSKTPTHQNLLINEVAWMGSIKSSSDEWIVSQTNCPSSLG